MALYEFKCKTCDSTFDVRRPMSAADEPAVCPDGHSDTVRLLSVFASVGAVGSADNLRASSSVAGSSGGCGSGCGCHH